LVHPVYYVLVVLLVHKNYELWASIGVSVNYISSAKLECHNFCTTEIG